MPKHIHAIANQRQNKNETREEFFWRCVNKESHPLGCWIWLGGMKIGKRIYRPEFCPIKGINKRIPAARYAWFIVNGPLNDDQIVYNLCQEERCVNPDHHEAVTKRERRFEKTLQWVDVDDALYLQDTYGVSYKCLSECFGYLYHSLYNKMNEWRHKRAGTFIVMGRS